MAKDKGSSTTPERSAIPSGLEATGWSLSIAGTPRRIPACGLLLGRSRGCDLCVSDDPDLSRRHARFSVIQDAVWVIDLGSSNGVVVDGELTLRAKVGPGAKLVLGRTLVEIVRSEGELPTDMSLAWSDLRGHPAEALRVLAGAASCSVEPNRSYSLRWEDGAQWDDLGPLRRTWLDAALSELQL